MRVGQEIEEFWSSEETEAETPKRNCFLQRDEDCFEDRWVALDQMVYDGMKELGWICWMSWTDTNGSKAQHHFRNSYRWKMWKSLEQTARHEFRDRLLPPFSLERIDLVRKLMKKIPDYSTVAIGAIQSGAVRTLGPYGKDTSCQKCGEQMFIGSIYGNVR